MTVPLRAVRRNSERKAPLAASGTAVESGTRLICPSRSLSLSPTHSLRLRPEPLCTLRALPRMLQAATLHYPISNNKEVVDMPGGYRENQGLHTAGSQYDLHKPDL
ncbi:unnamed protein product [Leuciscus chuanchicus]